MKKTRLLMLVFCSLLLAAMGYVLFRYVHDVNTEGGWWMNRSANFRLEKTRSKVTEGSILDSEGIVLAESFAPGERHYIEDKATRFAMSHTIGDTAGQCQNGVEARRATELLGLSDRAKSYHDLQLLIGGNPTGCDLLLTVSSELSTYMASLFPSGHKGAAVLLNYKTGAILGKVSLPGFDVANVDIAHDEARGYSYYDRVLSDQKAPGSTFKIVVLASALENLDGIENETFTCDGSWTISDYSIRCAGGTSHGDMDLREAFAESCNVTFSTIAYRLGAARLKATAEKFGFNKQYSFSEFALQPSHCLTTQTSGETLQAGIGQGATDTTPLHMALISGAIANGGVMMEPRIVREVRVHNGGALSVMEPSVCDTICDADTAYKLASYMYSVVQSGTGTRAKISGYSDGKICGKTGSAEFGTSKDGSTHAWYTGFIYGDDEHPYAIAVVVEGGGSGGSVAAPMASKIMAKAISLGLK